MFHIDARDQPFGAAQRIAVPRHQRASPNPPDVPNEPTANKSNESNDQTPNPEPSTQSPETSKSNEADNTSTQAGPSGLQSNRTDSTKPVKSNAPESNESASDEAGPSNRNVTNSQNAEGRQRFIIVQHRRQPSGDENGNMNR